MIDCIRKPTNAVVISHEKESTQRLFSAVRFFVENAIIPPRVSIYSKSEMRFPETGSYYYVGTAGQKAFGRGDTIQRAHLSEAAFYENLERILGGISEAAEYGNIDIETTPNGRGEFYDLWQKAKAGRSPYTPIFIPWFIDREYSSGEMTDEEKKGLSASVQEMFLIPEKDFEITRDEVELIRKAKADYNIDITINQLKWRRYKIWDKGDLFFQEYPEDDVSCFLQAGRSVFNHIRTEPGQIIPLDDITKWHGDEEKKKLLLAKKYRLYGGVDGAEGTFTGDGHCFSVIDIEGGVKGRVIFELHSHEPLDIFEMKVAAVCRQYDILIGVEKNGIGVAHIQKLRALGVPYLIEWETTSASRPVMITELEEAYRKEHLIEGYLEAENEARDMEYKDNNRAEHKQGKHDDRVFARAIAWQMRKYCPGVQFV
jgi:hypothetical protein